MRTKAMFVGLAVAFLAIPVVSSAATLSDLQAQITSLLSQIRNIELQGSATSSASVSGSGTVTGTVVSSCPSIVRSLSIGSRGDDVTSLQEFLAEHGYLNVSATGYFGALTKAAVGHWQSDNDITGSGGVGFGIFGPMSRSYFSRWCNGNGNGQGNNQQSFSADPQSGAAPLNVTFTTSDSITASSTTYSVDFGDGTNAAMTKGSCIAITAIVGGQGGIRCSYTVAHTYNGNGTYVAKLMKDTCPAGAQCFVGPQTVATQTITVGSSSTTGVNFTASPTTGAAPLTVQFSATESQGTTLGNTINFGDGTTGSLGFVPTCSSCNAMATASHTYAATGTYTATLTNNLCSCPANGICNCPNIPVLGTATITVTATTTGTTSDQRINAPSTVTLQQGGIAEVRNQNYYFTLNSLTASSATIQLTTVGCWNSFPSDPPPQIRCMIAVVPIPPITLSLGQTASNYPITLTQDNGVSATFSVGVRSSSY